MSRFVGRSFAVVEIDGRDETGWDAHVIYAFEVLPSPAAVAWRRLRHWAHIAWAGWST